MAKATTKGKPHPTPSTTGKTSTSTKAVSTIPKGGALAMLAPIAPPPALVDSGSTSPYVQFAHPLGKQWGQMGQLFKGIKEGWPVHTNGNELQHLDPFEFFSPPLYFQATCMANSNGDVIDAFPAGVRRENTKEYIWAVILVVTDEGIFPARMRFNGPKCPGYKQAITATKAPAEDGSCGDVYNPDWASRSSEHKAVLSSLKKVALPEWSMALHSGALSEPITPKAKPKPGEPGTRQYIEFTSSFRPTPIPTLATLSKVQQDENFAVTLKACIDDHNKAVEEIEAMIVKNS